MLRLLSAVVREITRCRTFPLPFFIIIMLPFPDECTGVDDVTLGWSDVAVDDSECGVRRGGGRTMHFQD